MYSIGSTFACYLINIVHKTFETASKVFFCLRSLNYSNVVLEEKKKKQRQKSFVSDELGVSVSGIKLSLSMIFS